MFQPLPKAACLVFEKKSIAWICIGLILPANRFSGGPRKQHSARLVICSAPCRKEQNHWLWVAGVNFLGDWTGVVCNLKRNCAFVHRFPALVRRVVSFSRRDQNAGKPRVVVYEGRQCNAGQSCTRVIQARIQAQRRGFGFGTRAFGGLRAEAFRCWFVRLKSHRGAIERSPLQACGRYPGGTFDTSHRQ